MYGLLRRRLAELRFFATARRTFGFATTFRTLRGVFTFGLRTAALRTLAFFADAASGGLGCVDVRTALTAFDFCRLLFIVVDADLRTRRAFDVLRGARRSLGAVDVFFAAADFRADRFTFFTFFAVPLRALLWRCFDAVRRFCMLVDFLRSALLLSRRLLF